MRVWHEVASLLREHERYMPVERRTARSKESSEPGSQRAWGCAQLWDGDFPGRGAACMRVGISAEGGMAVRSRQRPSEYPWTFQLGFLGLRKLRTF